MTDKKESNFDKLVKKSEKLEQGEYKMWVSFDALDLGKLMQYVFYPLNLLFEEMPDAIEKILTAADKIDALAKKLQENVFAPAQMMIKLAKKIVKTILKLIDKAFKLFLGGAIGGVDAKATSIIAPPHHITHLPMAEKLPYALDEACRTWDERPSGKKVYGFIFFPYYLPLARAINKGADTVDKRVEDATKKFEEVKKMLDALDDADQRRWADYEDGTLSPEEWQVVQDARDEAIIDGLVKSVSELDVLSYVETDKNIVEENALLINKNMASEDDAATSSLTMEMDNVGSGTVLIKNVKMSPDKDDVRFRLVLNSDQEWWISSISIVGQNEDGTHSSVQIYRNKYYDAMIYAHAMYHGFYQGVEYAMTNMTGDAQRFVQKVLRLLKPDLNEDTTSPVLSQVPDYSLDDLDATVQTSAEIMTFLAMYKYCVKDKHTLKDAEDENSYYNSMTINYQQIQRYKAEKHISGRNLFGTKSQVPLHYHVNIPKSVAKEIEKLDLGNSRAKLVVNTMSIPPYAFPDEYIVSGGDAPTPEDLIKTMTTFFDYHKGRYDIVKPEISGTYIFEIGSKPVIEKDAATRRKNRMAHEGGAESTTPINTYAWYGASTESLTLKQLLPKKAVKNIHKAKKEVDRTGKLILDSMDILSDMVSDSARITDMIRDLLTRALREDIVDIINALKDAMSMPALGMVVGVANVDAASIGSLVNAELRNAGVHKDVIGGTLVVGGAAILSTLLDYFKLINESKEEAEKIIAEIENLTQSHGSANAVKDIIEEEDRNTPPVEEPYIPKQGEVKEIESYEFTMLEEEGGVPTGTEKSAIYLGGGEDVQITDLITTLTNLMAENESDKIKIPRLTRNFLLRGKTK